MKKYIFFSILFFGSLFLTGCSQSQVDAQIKTNDKTQSTTQVANKQVNNSNQYPVSSIETVADKVQVFLFHATQRCTTCTAIGRLAGETVNERFQDELKSGKIEFREVNIDLPENKELARKFKASGSALYLNAIKGDINNIEQDAKVWRLTSDPDKFKDYLTSVIYNKLGK